MKRKPSYNDSVLKNVNHQDTKITQMTFKGESLNVFVNPSINIAINADDQKKIYTMKNGKLATEFGQYICIHAKIKDVVINVSRHRIAKVMLGDKFDRISVSKINNQSISNSTIKNNENLSLNELDCTKTKVITKNNTEYVYNPDVTVMVDLMTGDGYNIETDRKLAGKSVYVKYVKNKTLVAKTVMTNRLCALMWGIDIPTDDKKYVVTLKDESFGYVRGNIEIVEKSAYMARIHPKGVAFGNYAEKKVVKLTELKNVVRTFITEDDMKFNCADQALEHQIKLDKAKDVAQLVVDSSGGYELGEQVFLRTMDIERKNVKYKNFVEMLKNNNGVQEVFKQRVDVGININDILVDADKVADANAIICEIKVLLSNLQNI